MITDLWENDKGYYYDCLSEYNRIYAKLQETKKKMNEALVELRTLMTEEEWEEYKLENPDIFPPKLEVIKPRE